MKKLVYLCALGGILYGQEANPTQQGQQPPPKSDAPVAIFRVTVVSRTTPAVNYQHRNGATDVGMHGTDLMPESTGYAKVQSNTGASKITVDLKKMRPVSSFGPEYLTYVLWAITPEGRANNLGEVVLNGSADHRSIDVATELQAFGLIVTAEPYWAVTQPSDVVVMENFIRPDTTGTIQHVEAKYELLQRGNYEKIVTPATLAPMITDTRTNLQLREARAAIAISKATGADKYAADTIHKAEIELQNAEGYNSSKGDKRSLETTARAAVQMAEDARIITLRKERAEDLENERAAAAQRELSAKQAADAARQQADEQTRLRAEADLARASAEKAKAEAMAASAQAQADKAAADAARQEADAARQAALAEQAKAQAEALAARNAASQANSALQQSEAEKQRMRQQLLAQLNAILQTRDTARGLIVNMSDVLFDFGKATLRPEAREKLAKLSGIVLAYPGLKLALEGHTDSIGSDEFNQTLSEKRAMNVRDYLVAQGLNMNSLSAIGLGKSDPIASNDTNDGRQQNRRVEMIVSGDVIGQSIGGATTPPQQQQ
jgi:outer membrane protein OmpA-like peptidoglycan-associated protein